MATATEQKSSILQAASDGLSAVPPSRTLEILQKIGMINRSREGKSFGPTLLGQKLIRRLISARVLTELE
jgi:hypothetical protein